MAAVTGVEWHANRQTTASYTNTHECTVLYAALMFKMQSHTHMESDRDKNIFRYVSLTV